MAEIEKREGVKIGRCTASSPLLCHVFFEPGELRFKLIDELQASSGRRARSLAMVSCS